MKFMMKPNHCTRETCVWSQTWSCPPTNPEGVQAAQEQSTSQQHMQTRPIVFASKSMSSVERRYSNIEREVLGILHGLEKFNHYCFVREVSIIPEHKPLVAIFKKEVATISQGIQ